MCPLTYLFYCKAFQSTSPLPLPFQCQAAIAIFFNVNSCNLPPADLPGNVPPLAVLPLAGLHATSFGAVAFLPSLPAAFTAVASTVVGTQHRYSSFS